MKKLLLVFAMLWFARSILGQQLPPIVISDGEYQFVRAGDSPATLFAAQVTIKHKQDRVFISLDGSNELEIRLDAIGGFIFADLPSPPGGRVSGASEMIYTGHAESPRPGDPVRRLQGEYRIIFPGGEIKGTFALYPSSMKKG